MAMFYKRLDENIKIMQPTSVRFSIEADSQKDADEYFDKWLEEHEEEVHKVQSDGMHFHGRGNTYLPSGRVVKDLAALFGDGDFELKAPKKERRYTIAYVDKSNWVIETWPGREFKDLASIITQIINKADIVGATCSPAATSPGAFLYLYNNIISPFTKEIISRRIGEGDIFITFKFEYPDDEVTK